jgi:copper homeostasis protein
MEIARGKQMVFHRAFDVVPDPVRSLDQLIDLGFSRVLTSGQRSVAVEGRDLIRDLIVRASQRIEVMPAGGVRQHNVRQLVEVTGCTQVLMTAFSTRVDASTSASCLKFGSVPGSPSSSYECVDRRVVQRMKEILEDIAQEAK